MQTSVKNVNECVEKGLCSRCMLPFCLFERIFGNYTTTKCKYLFSNQLITKCELLSKSKCLKSFFLFISFEGDVGTASSIHLSTDMNLKQISVQVNGQVRV